MLIQRTEIYHQDSIIDIVHSFNNWGLSAIFQPLHIGYWLDTTPAFRNLSVNKIQSRHNHNTKTDKYKK